MVAACLRRFKFNYLIDIFYFEKKGYFNKKKFTLFFTVEAICAYRMVNNRLFRHTSHFKKNRFCIKDRKTNITSGIISYHDVTNL